MLRLGKELCRFSTWGTSAGSSTSCQCHRIWHTSIPNADGFHHACTTALEAVEARAFDNATDTAAIREDLLGIARTTLSSKMILEHGS